jgi:hypothetical protein
MAKTPVAEKPSETRALEAARQRPSVLIDTRVILLPLRLARQPHCQIGMKSNRVLGRMSMLSLTPNVHYPCLY